MADETPKDTKKQRTILGVIGGILSLVILYFILAAIFVWPPFETTSNNNLKTGSAMSASKISSGAMSGSAMSKRSSAPSMKAVEPETATTAPSAEKADSATRD